LEARQQNNSGNIGLAFGEEAPDDRVAIDTDRRSPASGSTAIDRTTPGRIRKALLLRNVGLLWIALGTVMTALSVTSGQGLKLSVWLWLGAACYAAYRFHNVRAAATPVEQGHARLIPDAEWQRVLGAIETRRAMPRNVHNLVPRVSTLQQYRDRFAWQHQQGRLSDAELQHRLATVDELADALDPARKRPGQPT
jgi:hypothetical protein